MLQAPNHAPLAVTTRLDDSGKAAVESVHYGSVAVADAAGNLLYAVGDPDAIIFTRSALKPFQALALVATGGASRFGFSTEQMALLCASHSGEPMHTQGVADMLSRIGCGVHHLQCGSHVPSYFASVGRRAPAGARYTALHHNCSGKHTGMLAYCRHHGHSVEDYLDISHPVQKEIRAAVAHYSRQPVADLVAGIDGCSAPNYALPLSKLAASFARLAQGLPDPRYGGAARSLFDAMTAHPEMVSGTQRFDLALMQARPGDIVAKVGAEGVQTFASRSGGWGVAIKIADGNTRAANPVAAAVMEKLGVVENLTQSPLADYAQPEMKNYRGRLIGHIRPTFEFSVG